MELRPTLIVLTLMLKDSIYSIFLNFYEHLKHKKIVKVKEEILSIIE